MGIDPYLAGYDAEDISCKDVKALFGEGGTQVAMSRLFSAASNKLVKSLSVDLF